MSSSRRQLLLQLGGMIGSAAAAEAAVGLQMAHADAAAASTKPTGPNVFNIADHGAKGDGSSDCTAAIRMALDRAAKSGAGTVYIPRGNYVYAAPLPVGRNVTMIAASDSLLTATSARQAIRVCGDNVMLRGLRLRSDAAYRKEANDSHAIAGLGAMNLVIEDCLITGASAAGIYLEGCRDFVIRNNTIVRTLADTIHMTGGSANGVVAGNSCLHGGDDGIAVVSYARQQSICRGISIVGNTVTGGNARGIAVSGGTKVRISRNRIGATRWAGIYIASEQGYETYSASEISVEGNELTAVNRAADGGTHACITIVGRPGRSLVGDIYIPNQNSSISLISNTVHGDGMGGIRADKFTRDISAIGNLVAETAGWGIQSSALGAAFIGNRIDRAARGGILVGSECLGGKTRLVGNDIHLANGWTQPAIFIERSQLIEAVLRSNRIQYDQPADRAIQIAAPLLVRRQDNVVNGHAVD